MANCASFCLTFYLYTYHGLLYYFHFLPADRDSEQRNVPSLFYCILPQSVSAVICFNLVEFLTTSQERSGDGGRKHSTMQSHSFWDNENSWSTSASLSLRGWAGRPLSLNCKIYWDCYFSNELCFWTLSIVWCLKKKQNDELKIYTKYHNTHVHKQITQGCEVCSGWVTYCHLCLTGFKGLCVCPPR
jgi:hypothetical protein